MKDKKNIELTEEELDRVNKIIIGIQTDLNSAIENLKAGDFELALKYVNSGISKSNCPLCKRELGILIADIVHNKQICLLNSDSCEEEQKVVIDKAKELKEDFVPVVQTKKAIKDKKKTITELEKSSNHIKFPDLLPPHIMFHGLFKKK